MSDTSNDNEAERRRRLDATTERSAATRHPAALVSPYFIRNHTCFSTFNDMVDASGFDMKTIETFGPDSNDRWDAFIDANTDFATWREMLESARIASKARNALHSSL
jgi:hypothetical protein